MLIVALMSIMLMSALGGALVLTTTIETTIAGNHREGTAAFYAAETAIEWTMQELRLRPDWGMLTAGGPYIDSWLDDLLPPGPAPSRMRILVNVAPVPGDAHAGLDVLRITAHAYGAGGGDRAIEVTVGRSPASGPVPLTVLYWRELR
jgi:hypothetical protein